MILTEKETLALKELQQQEKVCMEHYTLYANTAKDCGLRDLFLLLQFFECKCFFFC